MASALHNPTLIHNYDHICIPDCGKAVCNNDAGSILHDKMHGILNSLFCSGIQVGGGFIQNQYVRVGNKGSGDSQKLALALD